MSRASVVSDTPQRNRNNIPDLIRAMSVKVSVKDGKIVNEKTWERGWRYVVQLALLVK